MRNFVHINPKNHSNMKKMLIVALAVGTAVTMRAQDVYKQTGGEQNIEVLFAPLSGSPIAINGIKYRKFNSATSAIRAEVFLGFSNETSIDNTLPPIVDGTDITNGTKSVSEFNVQLSPGIEKHLTGTDRLSPYYGAVLDIGYGSKTERVNRLNDAEDDFEKAGRSTSGSLLLGVNGVAGFDYYFHDNIYLGTEIGFGVAYRTELARKDIPEEGDTVTKKPNGSSLGFGPNVVARIRLGILF